MEAVRIRVSQSGSGGCRTVAEALTLAKAYRGTPVLISIGAGVYHEKLTVSQDNLTLQGEGEVKIIWADGAKEILPDGEKRGTFRTATVMVDANGFTARGLTIENAAGPGAEAGQALALYADGDRLFFDRCKLLGHQDTLFTAPLPPSEYEPGGFRGPKEFAPRVMGRHYYHKCLIQGEVDFIFGGAAAWFEDCDLISLETGREINGYVAAPSTPEGEKFGYVFRRCRFTGRCREKSVYLGRPWRDHAKAVLLACELGPHIRPEGWHDWGKASARGASYFREYRSTGPGAQGERPDWTGQLSEEEAGAYTKEAVLGGWAANLPSQPSS